MTFVFHVVSNVTKYADDQITDDKDEQNNSVTSARYICCRVWHGTLHPRVAKYQRTGISAVKEAKV